MVLDFNKYDILNFTSVTFSSSFLISEGNIKKEKFKSNLNGITVSQLTPFKVDEPIQKEYVIETRY